MGCSCTVGRSLIYSLFVSHCLRLPWGNPEREVLMWRNYMWSRMNAILPPYTRVMQFTSGPVDCLQHWWEQRAGARIMELAQERDEWKAVVGRIVAVA
eukprot:2482976-Amphidinium_carterae.1